MRFSERYGFKSAREKLQIDSVDMELRNSLWSVLKLQIWDRVYFSRYEGTAILHPSHNPEMTEFCNRFWFSYSKKPLDTIPSSWPPVLEKLRTYFLGCEWYEVYDFLEFVAQNFPFNNKDEFIKQSNLVLEREMSGYRFTGNTIAPITDETEIGEIDLALSDPTATVRAHLKRALELLSDRTNPDYRNSMKESISAVESLVVSTLGEKGTLGQLTKKLEDELKMHPALCKALNVLYGFTSDAHGIRHALMELPTVTFDEAKFLLVICSAFVNFVQAKVHV